MLALITLLSFVDVGSSAPVIHPVSASDSVIVFAANTLAASINATNNFVLQSLYSYERDGIDVSDTHAVYEAARVSRRQAEPAWHARLAREFARRASFVTDSGVECEQLNQTTSNNGASTAQAFLGPSVFLESTAYIDINCNERFDGNQTDLAILDLLELNGTLTSSTGERRNATTFQLPLEIVQSTADVRLKRIIAFVPVANGSDTGLFFQPGLAAAFLPLMAAFEINVGEFTNQSRFGYAMYPQEGNSEAVISFIDQFDTRCASADQQTTTRFNRAPIDLRLALSSNETTNSSAGFDFAARGAVYGLCSTPDVRALLRNDTNANLLAGIFFIDSNADGMRNPREQTTSIPHVTPLVKSGNFLFNAHQSTADGTFHVAISSNTSFGTFAVGNGAPSHARNATVEALLSNDVQRNADGSIPEPSICGNASSGLRVSSRLASLSNNDRLSPGIFLNQATATNSSTARVLGATAVPLFRQPNSNIGFTCVRTLRNSPVIDLVAHCDAAQLNASQAQIVDTFTVRLRGTPPAYQTWLTAVTARDRVSGPIDGSTMYDAFTPAIGVTFFQPNVHTRAAMPRNEGPSRRVDVVLDAQARDVNATDVITFNITITVPFARPSFGLNCSGVPGEEIVSELILTDYDGFLPNMRIGDYGALCRHTQPTQCVGGGIPSSTPPSTFSSSTNTNTGNGGGDNGAGNGGTLGTATSGVLPIAAIYAGVALILIFVMVAVASR